MSYYVIFKDKRSPIKVTDEQAIRIAEAKDVGKQIKTASGYTDPVMIAEIIEATTYESRGQVNVSDRQIEDFVPTERSSYNLALIAVMKASRAKKVEIPEWVKPEHRQLIRKTPVAVA